MIVLVKLLETKAFELTIIGTLENKMLVKNDIKYVNKLENKNCIFIIEKKKNSVYEMWNRSLQNWIILLLFDLIKY